MQAKLQTSFFLSSQTNSGLLGWEANYLEVEERHLTNLTDNNLLVVILGGTEVEVAGPGTDVEPFAQHDHAPKASEVDAQKKHMT